MALSSLSYYSNAITGYPTLVADADILSANAIPKFPVGFGFKRADGNVFRYVHVGTATNAGLLIGSTVASGAAAYNAAVIVAPASAQVVPGEPNITAGSAGSHYVEVTIAAIAADKYRGGYFAVTRGTTVGETYRILGNTATGTPASGNLRIQFAEAIKVAFAATSGSLIVPSIFTDMAAATSSTVLPTGVLMSTTTSTNIFAWVCTHGIVGVQEDATTAITAGNSLIASRLTAGAVAASTLISGTQLTASFGATTVVGYCYATAGSTQASGKQMLAYITLE